MRLFIALPLSDDVRSRLAAVQDDVRGLQLPVKLVRPEAMHLTLAFLGETPEDRVAAVQRAMVGAAGTVAPFRLTVSGLGVFPNARHPSVLWAGLTGELAALTRLHAALGDGLRAAGLPVEERAFRPHVTLGRSRERWGEPERDALRRLLDEAREHLGDVPAFEMHLVESGLRREGARYTTLYTSPLVGDGEGA